MMSSDNLITVNPFQDASRRSSQPTLGDDTTIEVGRNASLSLGTDSLIILDEGFEAVGERTCCGLLRKENKATRVVPFFNVLWAEILDLDLVIRYAHHVSPKVVRVATVRYLVDKPNLERTSFWTERLLNRAYGQSQRKKRIKVLVNPFSGKGSAQKWFTRDIEPIFAAAQSTIDVERTKFKGHAIQIAENIDIDAYDVIAACSGDGLPHEILNGLGKKADSRRALFKIAVVQLPCGSGNAMSWNLNGTDSTSLAALCVVKGIRTPLDLISITQGTTRSLSFLSQAVGIVAESDLATEHLRFLGDKRFVWGFLSRLLGKTVYPCDLAVKTEIATKAEIREHYKRESRTRASIEEHRRVLDQVEPTIPGQSPGLPTLQFGSIQDDLPPDWTLLPYDKLGNFYCGNMTFMAADSPFFAATLPHDGHMDLVTIDGDISRMEAIKMLLAVEKNKFFDMPLVTYRKVSAYRIIPKGQKDGYISIDGERVPFAPFQAEIHQGLGTVLSRSGHLYESKGI